MIACEKEIKCWLSIAKEAAMSAGRLLSKQDQSDKQVHKDSGRDIKIAADLRAEQVILGYLREKSDFSILSEEKGFVEGNKKDLTWIVDPLDGSFNYARGIPISCVSVGLWQGEVPVLGAVYDFNRSEMFSGISRGGAYLNDEPIGVSDAVRKDKSVLCTGFPSNTDFSNDGITLFIKDAQSYKKMRLLGSAALSISYVACGRADAYCEKGIMFWDIAGSIPILLAAGGKLDMKRASKEHSYDVYVSNRNLTK